ncbi:uncharacterized protein LOC118434577 [Folsomia candida]|uniref:uncharacterized protein LOC118434577 n=1 Tax=Folsomia candida TaxID=158441 RepID=UPI0016055657|nr:uncharacterized protein LOC118434577 [Folsomia candida]
MYHRNLVIFLCTLILIRISTSTQDTIFNCCKSQHSFDNQSFRDAEKLSKFQEILSVETGGGNNSDKIKNFHLKLNHFELQCDSDKLIKHFVNFNTIGFPNDGYVTINEDLFLAPESYCVDSLSNDLSEVVIVTCDEAPALPKCCPWGKLSRWLHPELCKKFENASENLNLNENLLLRSKISESRHKFYWHPLNCINENKMVETATINLYNQSELDGIIAQLIPGSFCFDDVLVSHDLKFDWQKNVALFYCGQSWPYNEFGVTNVETVMYGGCLSLSAVFLLAGIAVYAIRLKQTHCHIHTWIELFYMISLLSLAVFCILHINFPEDHLDFCSLYHLFSVFGYFVSAIGVFTWATLLSLELFLAFKDLRPVVGLGCKQNVKRLIFNAICGHFFPLLVTCCTFAYSFYWKNTGYCVNTDLAAVRIILAALLVVNTICFGGTLYLILRHRRCAMLAVDNKSTQSNQRLNQLISCFIKLYLICGITFVGIIIGYFTGTVRSSAWYFMFYRAFLNLRGVTVFVIFVCNKKTKTLLWLYFNQKGRRLCRCGICNKKTTHIKRGIYSRRSDSISL